MEKEKVETVKRKVWYQQKIEDLEAKVAELQAGQVEQVKGFTSSQDTLPAQDLVVESGGTYNDGYADGFFDCLGKYGVLSKLQRRRLHELLKLKGPGAVKSHKRSRFSFSVPSI